MTPQDDNRPNPDELLHSLKLEEEKSSRGKLKIFFGMCAGVGKTYTMLQAAHAEKEKGREVLIGYVETHNRPETNALLEGLESISSKILTYKDTAFREVDTDAVLNRRPELVLIDELAHTNAPGSRHKKRFQDVTEILDQGIDVFTTVNVQHIESRSDTVAQITGVIVRETVPDEIFDKADEVELVDIPPDDLLQRFQEGKVYAPENSREALKNFFRKGNLIALREMALRIVAERVDKQVREYMQQKRITGPWKSGLRLMAVIGPGVQSAKLLRWAKTLSSTLGATLMALYVESPGNLSADQKSQLSKNIHLAKQLGAEVITTSGQDRVRAILRIAQKENITHILIGKPRHRSMISLLLLGNFINKLIRYSGNIDVYVLGADVSSDQRYRKFLGTTIFHSGPAQYLLAGGITILTALVFFMARGYIGYQIVSYALLFAITIQAIFLGIGPILLSATLSALLWDFFFIPPMFTLHIEKAEDVMMEFMFFSIALLNGILTSRVRRQEQLTREREERTSALYRLTNALALATGLSEVLTLSVTAIRKYFRFDCTILLQTGNNELGNEVRHPASLLLSPPEMSVATWVFQNSRKAGKYTDTLPSGDLTFFPLTASKLRIGVVAARLEKPFSEEEETFWNTFITQISNDLEREFLNDLARKASILDESDKLYKALFNSISHELRIPVSAIMGASETLSSVSCDADTISRLQQEIFTASERLSRLIDNLLNMSRLESGRITPRLEWCDPHDLVNKVTESLKKELTDFVLEIVVPGKTPLVRFDFGLMEQVLYNLVLNAIQYSPKGSTIRIKLYYDTPNFVLVVMDRGPGFPPDSIS